MYNSTDIGVVIPTYDRAYDVERTINVLLKNNNHPGAIYVVDQSHNDKTKKAIYKIRRKFKNIFFIRSKQPSTAIASNTGIELAKRKFKIVLMLDDDVDCPSGFFNGLLQEFNENEKVYGCAAWARGAGEEKNPNSIKNRATKAILNFFLLPSKTNMKFKVLGPYGNTGSYNPIFKRRIEDAEWLSGVNMCYKKEVFEDYKIPESIGYNLLQDMDASYYVFKKYGKGSLVITDKTEVIHRGSQVGRYPDYKRAFVSQEDRFIFYYRFFNDFLGTLKFGWSVFGLVLLKTFNLIFKPNSENFFKIKYFLESFWYCFKNRQNIRSGKYRAFLNKDTSMKLGL